MGNKGKNNERKVERNKKSKASKMTWYIRKQKAINGLANKEKLNATPLKVYKDLGADLNIISNPDIGDVGIQRPPSTRATRISSDGNNSVQHRRNPNWCTKTYLNKKKQILTPSCQLIIPFSEHQNTTETTLEIEKEPRKPSIIFGNRVVELGYVLNWAINLQCKHSSVCTGGKVYVHKEVRSTKDLSSSIIFKCTQCDAIIQHKTEDPNKSSEMNWGALWPQEAHLGHPEELLSSVNIPCALPKAKLVHNTPGWDTMLLCTGLGNLENKHTDS